MIKVLSNPSSHESIFKHVQMVWSWINLALAYLKPTKGNCIRTVRIQNQSEYNYYHSGKVFSSNNIVSATKLESKSDSNTYEDKVLALKTDFADKEGKKKGSKLVFHIHSVWGKGIDEFLGGQGGTTGSETIAFSPGSEFLVCKRQEENIGGYNVLNVYLREIQTGLSKDVILWLDAKTFEKGVFHDVSNKVG